MNTLYPIFLKLENKPVLVIGGGKVAEQKIKGLLDAQVNVTVISPKLTRFLEDLLSQKKISAVQRVYQKGDVEGYILVFAATNDPAVHQEIFDDAVSRNIPVNVVDVPDLCNFYLASVFQNGDLKVAVSTNGKSPTLGKIIRDRIAAEFRKGYPELLDTLGEIRPSVHSIYSNPDKRKEVLEKIVDDELRKNSFHAAIAGNPAESGMTKQSTEQMEGGDCFVPISSEPAMTIRKGKVILVGAGPGDPDLISVKGLRAIQKADVIAYDALVSPELLSSAKQECEKIFVGKRSGGHYVVQEETNKILIEKAKEGKNVIRLKGGDPFVFGRGGEEVEALRAEGIDVEIIPGITAGIGIPSSMGIPLTHRGISSNIVFVTGTEMPDKNNKVNWNNIAAIDTIVVYMGIKKIPEIIEKLFDAGRSALTSVMVVFGGTTNEQVVVEGTLQNIVNKVDQINTASPGIIIIGDVVNMFSSQNQIEKEESLS